MTYFLILNYEDSTIGKEISLGFKWSHKVHYKWKVYVHSLLRTNERKKDDLNVTTGVIDDVASLLSWPCLIYTSSLNGLCFEMSHNDINI